MAALGDGHQNLPTSGCEGAGYRMPSGPGVRIKAIYNTGQINSPENTAPWMLEAALALLSLRSL